MINEWLSQIDKRLGFITLDFRNAFDVLSHNITSLVLTNLTVMHYLGSTFFSCIFQMPINVKLLHNFISPFTAIETVKFKYPHGTKPKLK